MNKLFTLLLALVALTSCGGVKYNILGTSTLPTFDGKKLYIKVIKEDDFVAIDSCEVVHGNFSFNGSVDSVKMAMLFMDDNELMPLVLEEGDIKIDISETKQEVSGTELNKKLYTYVDKRTQIENDLAELPHKSDQMMLDGYDEADIMAKLSPERDMLFARLDSLDTHFVKENFDNVLGAGVFMSIVSNNQAPVLTPQLEDILSSAPESFKQNPVIKQFLEAADEYMKQMQYVPGQATEEARQEQMKKAAEAEKK